MAVEKPNFLSMLQDLKRGTFHLSTNWISIPSEYMGTTTPSTGSGSGGRSATSGAPTTVSGVSGSSTVSTITTPTQQRDSVARVENPAPDTEFTTLTLRSGGTRTILRANRPPTNDAGNELCVAWWTRSGCYPNCGRCNTHLPFASASERTRLLAYVRQHLVAPTPTATT